jgi:hypothetical protein
MADVARPSVFFASAAIIGLEVKYSGPSWQLMQTECSSLKLLSSEKREIYENQPSLLRLASALRSGF